MVGYGGDVASIAKPACAPPRTRAAEAVVVAVGVGDFDHNGVGDIMWRDTGNGHLDNWILAYS